MKIQTITLTAISLVICSAAFAKTAPVSGLEAANAVLHCGTEASKLIESGSDAINAATLSSKKSGKLKINTYTLKIVTAGGLGGPRTLGSLIAEETIDHTPKGAGDMINAATWKCSVTN